MLVACGGTQPAATTTNDALGRLVAARDEQAILALLSDDIQLHGIWFADPRCRFDGIAIQNRPAFARCLASLHLAAGIALHDVAFVTYGPGVELAVKFNTAGKLNWIGFTTGDPHVVSISQHALEALRTEGDPAPASTEQSWFGVCIDHTGATTKIRPLATSSFTAHPAFRQVVESWKHAPFLLGGTHASVCAVVHVGALANIALPLEAEDKWIGVTAPAIEHRRVAGIIPKPGGTYFVCVEANGKVRSLQMRVSGDYDRQTQQAIRSWAYEPLVLDDHFVDVCFEYSPP